MNIYALLPLIATIAYIPLLITTIGSRPWQKRHRLFILFLIPAMLWSLTDFFFRSNLFPEYNLLLFKAIVILFMWMVVQFHCFSSSFFTPGQGRWLPFAYASLAAIIVLVGLGYIPEGVNVSGDKLYPVYGTGVIFMAISPLTLAARNLYVFWRRLRILDNPVLYNQIVSLVFGILALTIFTLAALLPWGKEFPVSHFGNLLNAFILSYAIIRHQLTDVRVVLRQWLAWACLGAIGIASYVLLFSGAHAAFNFGLDLTTTFIATLIAMLVAIVVYMLRRFFFATVDRAFQRQSYKDRRELFDFASRIYTVFSFKKQGRELLTLVARAIGCRKAGLLFPEADSGEFAAQLVEPESAGCPLSSLRLSGQNPIVEYLERERKLLSRESLAILPEFRSLRESEKKEIRSSEIELFMPLISRDRLTGILVLDKKKSGRYSLEDLRLLEDVAGRVAVSMEKEYLREQLGEREAELSVINRSSAIMTSSLDIQAIYDSFIMELKKVVDVSWAAIVLIEEDHAYFLALSSEIGSAWQVGERVPIKGTATEWVARHKEAVIEPALELASRFTTGKYHFQQGVRSIAYLPLIVKGEVIGSAIMASRHPNAYSQRQVKLLEQLASQIAMPIENSRLYAEAEHRARIDELTGLLNRRSLNEMITSEIGRHSRYGGVFSLIILDLDSFKAFNDNYGHLAGDKLLKQIGSIIKGTIRNIDEAFRHGGDEFAVLLPQTGIDAAHQVAERVRKRVEAKINVDDVPVTASLGLASWPADGIDLEDIIAAADGALYNAKRGGGNRSHCASGTLLPLNDIVITTGNNDDSKALSTIYTLAAAVDARDHYTRSHSKKVTEYAMALAKALELEPLELSRLSNCALLHDVGKIGTSDEILNKPGKLTAEEWEVVKLHPQLGATIVSHVPQLASCAAGILHHHERYDGSGYPRGLKGEDIPLEARILAIADAFAAMTSKRSYSDTLPFEEALKEIKRGAGRQFDPNLVEVFLSAVEDVTATEKR